MKNWQSFVEKACCASKANSLAISAPRNDPVGPQGDMNIAEGPIEMVKVSIAKAKSIQAERRQREKREQAHAADQITRAKQQAIDEYLATQWDSLLCEPTDETTLAGTIHTTHKRIILCGGYVGCLKCGRFTLTYGNTNHLKSECRLNCPPGSAGATRRMLRGEHPLAGKGKQWPSGEAGPRPRRLVRPF